jgi:ADP-heptose:LPS heptosyltransferase
MPASPLHPIVIWFGRVGDMILLSTLLDILQRRYGGRCHVIGAGAWPAEIYATHPAVASVTCLHRYTAFLFDSAWWRALRRLRASRADPVYVCEYDSRKLARVRRLLKFSGTDPARCLFITDTPSLNACESPLPQTSPVGPTHWGETQAAYESPLPQSSPVGPTHWVDRLVSFGRLTPAAFDPRDYPWPSPPPIGAPQLQVSAAARAECAEWIGRQGWGERPLVLVQPGNRRTMRGRRLRLSAADDKAWPVERWAQLLRQLHARMPQAVLVLCGAPRESLLLSWICAAAQLPAVAAVELPLPRLLALCERAHSMISVDTGPAHAAAALSLPLVVLFGAHAQQEWLPRSPSGSDVAGVGGPPQSQRLDQIAVETVLAAWCCLRGRGAAAQPHAALKPTAANATAP